MTTVADYQEAELTRERVEALLEGEGLDFDEVIKKHLWDGRTFMRRNASMALRLSGEVDDQYVNLLTVAAKDSDGLVRENSVAAMAKVEMSVASALPSLLTALEDTEEPVRVTARNALDRLADRADEDEMAGSLVGNLSHPSGPARAAVSDLIMKFPEVSAPLLITALTQSSQEVSQEAYRNLVRMGAKAATALIEALPDPSSRPAAAALLVQLPALDDDEMESLQALTESDDEELARVAADVERELAGGQKAAPPPPIEIEGFFEDLLEGDSLDAAKEEDVARGSLLAALRDGRPIARANASLLLGLAAQDEEDEQERARMGFALAALVRDGFPVVRRVAVEALQRLGGSMAVGPLLVALSDEDGDVVAAARAGLVELAATQPGGIIESVSPEQPGICHITVMDAMVEVGEGAVEALARALTESPNVIAREIAAASLERIGKPASEAIGALVVALGDAATDVRRAAASALGYVAGEDEAVIGALKQASSGGDLVVRMAAATARARITGTWEPPEAAVEAEPIEVDGFEEKYLSAEELGEAANELEIERLVKALGDGRPVVRANAALALGLQGDEATEAAAPLAVAAKDGAPRVRAAAATALGQLGEEVADASVPTLVAGLADPDLRVQEAANGALSALGEAVLDQLAEALDMYTDLAERTVLPLLAGFGEAAVETLAGALEASSPRVRANAAIALARIGAPAAGAVDALLARLSDENEEVRAAAAGAFGFIEDDSEKVLEALKASRRDAATTVRRTASLAFDRLTGALDEPEPLAPIEIDGFEERMLEADEVKGAGDVGVERLIISLGAGRPEERHNAALALGSLGDEAADAASALAVVLRDGTAAVRVAATTALGALGEEATDRSVRPLVRALNDAVPEVAAAAETALKTLGDGASQALVGALDDKRASLGRVVSILVEIGESGIEAAVAVVTDEDVTPRGRSNAARVLGAYGEAAKKKGLKALLKGLDDESAEVRSACAGAIGLLGDDGKAVMEGLAKARRDVDVLVRRAAAHAVDRLSGALDEPPELEPIEVEGFEDTFMAEKDAAKEAKGVATERLIAALADGRPQARHNAAIALGASGADEAAMPLYVVSKDSDPRVRAAVCTALGALGDDVAEFAVPALVKRLTDPIPEVVEAASAAIEKLTIDSIPELIKELSCDPSEAAETVVPVLVALGEEIIEPLSEAVKNDELSAHIRVNALLAMGRLGPDHQSATEGIIAAAAGDPDELLRKAAKQAAEAAAGAEPPPKNLEPLAIPEEYTDQELKPATALKLGKELDVEVLRLALMDGRQSVRRNAALGLAAHAKKAAPALDNLLLALKDTIQPNLRAVAETLGVLKLEPERVGPALAAAVRGCDDVSQPVVLDALAAYGKKVVVPILDATLNDRPYKHLDNLITVARHLLKDFLKPLTTYLSSEYNPLIRENAADVLAAMGREAAAAEKALLETVQEMDNLLRMKVILALGRCTKNSKVQEILTRIQDEDERPEIQIAVEEALMYMGQP